MKSLAICCTSATVTSPCPPGPCDSRTEPQAICGRSHNTFTEAERVQRRRQALELNLAQHLKAGYHRPRWTAEHLALLGTLPDAEVGRLLGRTATAVRVMRNRRGIPFPKC